MVSVLELGKLAKKGTKRKLPSRREELQSPKTQNSSPTNAKGPRNRVKVFQRKSVERPPASFFEVKPTNGRA